MRIGLALSGGGFRATLFHAGVLVALHKTGLIHRVRVVSGASGGAIAASHLVAFWPKYSGQDVKARSEHFATAIGALVDFCRTDVRNMSVLWGMLGLFGRIVTLPVRLPIEVLLPEAGYRIRRKFIGSYVLRNRLRTLLARSGRDSLSALGESRDNDVQRPDFYFVTTNLNDGCLAYFSSDGFHWDAERPERGVGGNDITVWDAVTASACFPLLYLTTDVTVRTSVAKKERPRRIFLCDGGLCDNLALSPFLGEARNEVDFVLSVDATGRPSVSRSRWLGSLLALQRSITVSMAHSETFSVGVLGKYVLDGQTKANGVRLPRMHTVSIERIMERPDVERRLNVDQQKCLGEIRTDLDKFHDDEVRSLLCHGYFTCLEQLSELAKERQDPSLEAQVAKAWSDEAMLAPKAIESAHKDVRGVFQRWPRLVVEGQSVTGSDRDLQKRLRSGSRSTPPYLHLVVFGATLVALWLLCFVPSVQTAIRDGVTYVSQVLPSWADQTKSALAHRNFVVLVVATMCVLVAIGVVYVWSFVSNVTKWVLAAVSVALMLALLLMLLAAKY